MLLLLQTESNGMIAAFLDGLSPDQRFTLGIVLIGCMTVLAITITSIIAGVRYHNTKRETEIELIRDLLDQGRTAEEIEQIVRPADGWSRAMEHFAGKRRSRPC